MPGHDDKKPVLTRITSPEMAPQAVDKIADDKQFQLGFARKTIMHPKFPFSHSAVVFKDTTPGNKPPWWVFGRQTPFFLKPSLSEAKKYQGGLLNLFNNVTLSKIDNEKKYNFFPNQSFEAEMSETYLTGKEVKEIIHRSDETICKPHRFDLVHSNCYSASVTVLINALMVISDRNEKRKKDIQRDNSQILEVNKLIQSAAKDNFSIGIINQKLVRDGLDTVEKVLESRGLKDKPDDLADPGVNPLHPSWW